jgi:4-hydroxy-tetrahydrodipicolinate synthase
MFKGSMPALVTPMRADGSIDFDAWDRLLEFHAAAGTDAVVVGGTTGESPVLERAELSELIRRAAKRLAGRMPVIAASGTNGTAKSVALSKMAREAGADALLVVTPYYNRPTQEGLRLHFTAIADELDLPLIAYNVPSRTACDMLADTVARLSEHPRIVGIKEATGDVARGVEILRTARPGFLLISGDDATAADLMKVGGRGVISVTANVVPAAMHELCTAALAGDHGDAARINAKLATLHDALFVEANPIPVKYMMKRIGLLAANEHRLPMVPATPEVAARLAAELDRAGLLPA